MKNKGWGPSQRKYNNFLIFPLKTMSNQNPFKVCHCEEGKA